MSGARELVHPAATLAFAALAAALLAFESGLPFVAGLVLLALLIGLAARDAWSGLLALLPLAFALRPAPPAVGLQEAGFALLAAVACLRSVYELARTGGRREIFRRYRLPVLVAAAFFSVNLAVALRHDVLPADWMRGALPFAFLALVLPFVQALKASRERALWLVGGLAVLAALMAGHVVAGFFWHDLAKPYWLVGGQSPLKIGLEQLAVFPTAVGPYYERVTMLLPRSTDAILPGGVVLGVVVATLARDPRAALAATALALLSFTACLLTYTRSMPLSIALALGVFGLATAWLRRERLVRNLSLLVLLASWGGVVVYGAGIDAYWGGRLHNLAHAGESNVVTRLTEYRLAWAQFVASPLFGGGLGIRHTIAFLAPGGWVEQSVSYVHNWVLYTLKVSGVIGFAVYAWLLLTPALGGMGELRNESLARTATRALIGLFAIYALFFAVSRLIPFNLALAAAWAILLAGRRSGGQM